MAVTDFFVDLAVRGSFSMMMARAFAKLYFCA
jgi:hypothetical protein